SGARQLPCTWRSPDLDPWRRRRNCRRTQLRERRRPNEGVGGLISVSQAAEAKGGDVIPAAGPEGAAGVLMPIGGYYYEADRGGIPEYDDKWNNAGWEGWLTYHPADNPQRLDKPLAIVHSESAAIPQGVQTFLAGFAGEATAQWLEDVTQFDFYDNPEDVTRAADTVADHFQAGLEG
ncbi:MAG: hypothetical protein VX228_15925, partial [Pseudomonadota bacterium]|nr:hypothetical protein [Pseudomonadota bacterium]